MQILINHLTRMQTGRICVAGVELNRCRHVRPVQQEPLTRKLLAVKGGPLELGRIVDLGPTEFCGRVPEIEDRKFDCRQVKVIDQLGYQDFYNLCQKAAASHLQDIFGNELQRVHFSSDLAGTAAVAQQGGIRSLGCYWANSLELRMVVMQGKRKLRAHFVEGYDTFSVPVTDIRFCYEDHLTLNEKMIAAVNQWIGLEKATLVAVGLSRAYSYDSAPPRHWLQINNVFPLQASCEFLTTPSLPPAGHPNPIISQS